MVDPMHNLLLGSAKTFMKVWKESNCSMLIDYAQVQSEVDQFVTPSGIGRLPGKVEIKVVFLTSKLSSGKLDLDLFFSVL